MDLNHADTMAKARKNGILRVARLALLVVCFATVFSLVLTGNNGTMGNALAQTIADFDGYYTVGWYRTNFVTNEDINNGVYANNSTMKSTDFKNGSEVFPGTSNLSSNKTFSTTIGTSDVTFDKVAVGGFARKLAGSPADPTHNVISTTPGTMQYTAYAKNQVFTWGVNMFDLSRSSFLNSVLGSNSEYGVTYSISGTVSQTNCSTCKYGVGLYSSATDITPLKLCNDENEGSTNITTNTALTGSGTIKEVNKAANTTTPYIGFFIYGYKDGTNTFTFTVTNLTITINIIIPSSFNSESSVRISDGAGPQFGINETISEVYVRESAAGVLANSSARVYKKGSNYYFASDNKNLGTDLSAIEAQYGKLHRLYTSGDGSEVYEYVKAAEARTYYYLLGGSVYCYADDAAPTTYYAEDGNSIAWSKTAYSSTFETSFSSSTTRSADRLDSNADNWSVYSDNTNISQLNNASGDSINASSWSLTSYTNNNTATANGNRYYKQLKVTATDCYKYDGNTTPVSGYNAIQTVSGIGKVVIGEADTNVLDGTNATDGAVFSYDKSNLSTSGAWKDVYAKDTSNTTTGTVKVGFAYVKLVNRTRVEITVYFTANTPQAIKVAVSDHGDAIGQGTILCKGIDSSAPSSYDLDTTQSTVSSTTNFDTIDWIYGSSYTFSFASSTGRTTHEEQTSSKLQSPYIYYYQMARSDSAITSNLLGSAFANVAQMIGGTYNSVTYSAMTPFLADNSKGVVGDFAYDFANGYVKGSKVYPNGTVATPTNTFDSNNCKGNGYYQLRIYTVDMAGNYSSATSYRDFYFKVDYEEPEYTTSLSYVKNDIDVNVPAADNGAYWLTGQTTLKLTQTTISLSGNVIRFVDNTNTTHSIYYVGGTLVGIDNLLLASLQESATGSKVYLIPNTGIYYKLVKLGSGASERLEHSFIFSMSANASGAYEDYTFNVSPTIYNGFAYASAGVIDEDSYQSSKVQYSDVTWVNGANKGQIVLNIDRNNPVVPELNDVESTYFKALGLIDSKAAINNVVSRRWYTAGNTIPIQISFDDGDNLTTYGNKIKVYIGIKYNGFVPSPSTAAQTDFDVFLTYNGTLFGTQAYSSNVKLGDDDNSVGFRTIYVWAVDQAGNASESGSFYTLFDSTSYNVSADVKSDYASLFGSLTNTVKLVDENDSVVTSFKRGALLNVETTFGNSFIPYNFTRRLGDGATAILASNNTTGVAFTVDEAYSDYALWAGSKFRFTMDNADVTSYVNTGTSVRSFDTIYYELTCREIVSVEITSKYQTYKGVDADNNSLNTVPYVVSDGSDTLKQHLIQTFYTDYATLTKTNGTLDNSGATTIGGVPVNVRDGNYYVVISIAPDDAYYIMREPVASEYILVPAVMTVSFRSGSIEFGSISASNKLSDYVSISGLVGKDIDDYSTNGYVGGLSGFVGELGLQNNGVVKALPTSAAEDKDFHVGSYNIVELVEFAYGNYQVEFVGGTLSVTPKQIEVAPIAANKTFGNADPVFAFNVVTANLPSSVSDVFTGVTSVTNGDGTTTITPGSQWLQRASGENAIASVYAYTSSVEAFELKNSDYAVSINLSGAPGLTIEKRYVTISPIAGQSGLYTGSTTSNPATDSTYNPSISYSVSSADLKYTTSEYLSGSLKLNTEISTNGVEGDYNYFDYVIVSDLRANTSNVDFSLNVATFRVKVSASKIAVRVSLAKEFKFEYGSTSTLTANNFMPTATAYFNVSSASSIALSDLQWTVDSAAVTAIRSGAVGTYPVTIYGAQVKSSVANAGQYAVSVDSFCVTITPKTVFVTPVIATSTKIYGDSDNAYGITFAVVDKNGNDVKSLAGVSGNYRRVLRSSVTKYVFRDGSLYDSVTDANGEVTISDDKYYYSLSANGTFESNANYAIDYDAFEEACKEIKLSITPRPLTLLAASDSASSYTYRNFYGINKVYDGSVNVEYLPGTTSINIASQLVNVSDDVTITFNAEYDSASVGNRTIKFSSFGLDGAEAQNYVLYWNASTVYDAANVAQTVTIRSLTPGGSERITITKATYALKKSDFTVSKGYDGKNTLSVENVSISSACNLSKIPLAARRLNADYTRLSGTAISNNYTTSFSIVFSMTDMDAANFDYDNSVDSDVQITTGTNFLTVTVKNIICAITERLLDEDSIKDIVAIDRSYDGTAIADISVNYTDDYVINNDTVHDTASNVGINFEAYAVRICNIGEAGITDTFTYNGKTYYFARQYGVGTYSVLFKSVDNTVGSNYACGMSAEALTVYGRSISLTVNIVPAVLELDVTVTDAEYNGSSDIESGNVVNTNKFKVMTYQHEGSTLDAELANLSYSYNELYYSTQGTADASVTVDENGEVVRHAVAATQFVVTSSDASLVLSNYTLAGAFYNITGGRTSGVSLASLGLKTGAYDTGSARYVYEMKSAAVLNKKTLSARLNDITIDPKVYDGTTNGTAKVSPNVDMGVVVGETDKIAITASCKFKDFNVGWQDLDVWFTGISNTATADGVDYAKNYSIASARGTGKQIITPSYAVVDFGIIKKEWDGTNAVSTSSIVPSVFIPYNDSDLYELSYEFAVTGGSDAGVNDGTVFGVELTTARSIVNYNAYVAIAKRHFVNAAEAQNTPGYSAEATNFYATYVNSAFADSADYYYFDLNSRGAYYSVKATADFDLADAKAESNYSAFATKFHSNDGSEENATYYYFEVHDYYTVLQSVYDAAVGDDQTKAADKFEGYIGLYKGEDGKMYYLFASGTVNGVSCVKYDKDYYDVTQAYYEANKSADFVKSATNIVYQLADGTIMYRVMSDTALYDSVTHGYYVIMGGVRFDYAETDKLVVGIKASNNDEFIEKMKVKLSVLKIKDDAFNKDYDGTTDFHGELGVDYSISGSYASFIDSISAEFETVAAGSTRVVFEVASLKAGVDDSNFTFEGGASYIGGRINKIEAHAYLDNYSVEYGTALSNRQYPVHYSISSDDASGVLRGLFKGKVLPATTFNTLGDEIDLFSYDSSFGYFTISQAFASGVRYYVEAYDYAECNNLTSFDGGTTYYVKNGADYIEKDDLVTIPTSGVDYYTRSGRAVNPYAVRVNLTQEQYDLDKAAGVTFYEFNSLPGNVDVPSVYTVTSSLSNAAAYQYTMKVSGDSTNFVFVAKYPSNGAHAILTITKRKVYAFVVDEYNDGTGYAQVMKLNGAFPVVSIGYSATPSVPLGSTIAASNGLVNGQGESAIGNKPVALFGKYNSESGTLTALSKSSDIAAVTGSLGANERYVIYLDVSSAAASNYEVLNAYSDSTAYPWLLVEYPDLTGVLVSNTKVVYTGANENRIKYSDSKGRALTLQYDYYNAVETSTTAEDGTVSTSYSARYDAEHYLGADVIPVNAGVYFVKVTIKCANYRDAVTYVQYTINKASFKITVPTLNDMYDGSNHRVTAYDLRISNSMVDRSAVNIIYTKNGERVDGEISAAGSYVVSISYEADQNFNAYSLSTTHVIKGIDLTVVVETVDKTVRYDENADNKLKFTLTCDDATKAAVADLWGYATLEELIEDETVYATYCANDAAYVSEYDSEISDAGTYSYKIVSDNDGISLNGAVTGTYIVGVTEIKYVTEAGVTRVSISVPTSSETVLYKEATISYEQIVYTNLSKLSDSVDEDLLAKYKANNTYYNEISVNVPSLATYIHTADLAGIIRVKMLQGANVVQPTGTVTVSVRVPFAVEDDYDLYYVTAEGTLQKAEYTYSGGYATYTTNYVSTIVFVKAGTFIDFLNRNWWFYIIAGVVLAVIAVGISLPIVARKKAKMQAKVALVTAANAGEDISMVSIGSTEKAEELAEDTLLLDKVLGKTSKGPQDTPDVGGIGAVAPKAPEAPKAAPPTGAVGMSAPKAPEAPKAAPPAGAVGMSAPKAPQAPKAAPPNGAVGTKKPPMPKKAPPTGAVGMKRPPSTAKVAGTDENIKPLNPNDEA